MQPDWVPGEILKLGGEAMTPYLARLLEISLNSATIPRQTENWKVADKVFERVSSFKYLGKVINKGGSVNV